MADYNQCLNSTQTMPRLYAMAYTLSTCAMLSRCLATSSSRARRWSARSERRRCLCRLAPGDEPELPLDWRFVPSVGAAPDRGTEGEFDGELCRGEEVICFFGLGRGPALSSALRLVPLTVAVLIGSGLR